MLQIVVVKAAVIKQTNVEVSRIEIEESGSAKQPAQWCSIELPIRNDKIEEEESVAVAGAGVEERDYHEIEGHAAWVEVRVLCVVGEAADEEGDGQGPDHPAAKG